MLRRLSILGMSFAFLFAAAPTASAAPTPTGVWTVSPGRTATISKATLEGCNFTEAIYMIDGSTIVSFGTDGDGCGPAVTLPKVTYKNTTNTAQTLVIGLADFGNGFSSACPSPIAPPYIYWSDGTSTNTSVSVDHATPGRRSVAISDSGPHCSNYNVTNEPAEGLGNLTATVSSR